MALYQVDIQKSWQNEFWTNRYYIEVDSLELGLGIATEIVAIERAVHISVVRFDKYRVSDTVEGTENYIIVPLGAPGLRESTEAAIPLFNVARIDFPAGTGRPSRKYLRLPIQRSEVNGNMFENNFINFVNQNYGVPMGDLDGFVDPQGTALGTGQCSPNVGMRQLRRGSKRKTKSIL